MGLKVIKDKAINLKDINPFDYDVVIEIHNDGRRYKILKNMYMEHDDSYFHISYLQNYLMECYSSYNEVHESPMHFKGTQTRGFI